ncbi:MAG: hypothetical protein WD049_02670 [Candidatus Paceibacterota bacterium]
MFRLGDGEYEKGPIATDLELVPDDGDSTDHGTIQPDRLMSYVAYRQAIINTREHWLNGEDDE